jgi:hypothetical protein
MFSGQFDLALLVQTSYGEVQSTTVVILATKLERLGTWCAYEPELQILQQ